MTSELTQVPANGSANATALCNSATDILLNGGCSINVGYAMVVASYPTYPGGTGRDAWSCAAANITNVGVELTAYVTCIVGP